MEMTASTILKRAVTWYDHGMSVNLIGPIGRGKSETIAAVPALLAAKHNKRYGFVVINAPLLTPMDAVGLAMPVTKGETLLSQFTKPFWWWTEEGLPLEAYHGGIVFVDELDKADPDIKKVIGEGFLSKRIGPHVLPPGWIMWSAGNRAEDRSGSTKSYDHLIARQMHIHWQDDLESWKSWAFAKGIEPTFIAFANAHWEIVTEPLPKVQGPWCNPRALADLARYMASMADERGDMPADGDMLSEATGRIGAAAAAQLFAYIRLRYELPTFEEIVAKPTKVKLPTAPDAQMLTCYSLAARVGKDTMDAVVTFMERMPGEFAIAFAKTAVTRDAELVMTGGFSRWASKNSSLMNAIVS